MKTANNKNFMMVCSVKSNAIRRKVGAGFTLIELLVVIAVTSILLGLIFGPLTQSFDLTNRARVQVEVQDNVRRLSDIGQIDLAQSVFIFDNTGQSMNFWVRQPDAQGNPLGAVVPQPVPFTIVDMVPPAQVGDQQVNPAASTIDPTTGQLQNRGGIAQPLAPGRTIVRYFVGLRDNASKNDATYGTNGTPIKPYFNYYDLPNISGLVNHNPFVLWRAEVSPYTAGGYVDTRFFHTDAGGNVILYDPNFWYDNSVAVQPGDPLITSNSANGWKDNNNDGQVNISENWRAIAKPMVPLDKADEVTVAKDEDNKPVYFPDPTNTYKFMKITPLVKFEPSYVGNDAGVVSSTNDYANGQPNIAASSYRESYGHWTSPFDLYVYRGGLAGPLLNYFYWSGGSSPVQTKTFDTGTNASTSNNTNFYPGNYDPDKVADNSAKSSSQLIFPADPNTNTPPILFYVDRKRGLVHFSVPDSIWPGFHDPTTGKETPDTSSVFYPDALNNAYLNYVYPGYPANVSTLSPNLANARPYADLTNLPPVTGSPTSRTSPLSVLPNIMITPGTENVSGPDMRPGPNYGKRVAYTGVSEEKLENLGPNEYVIHYQNISNANLSDPDPMNVARQKMGVLLFWKQGINKADPLKGSAAGSPLTTMLSPFPTYTADGTPVEPIRVRYKMQNNLISDIVKANYLSRELISFTAGVRLYDFHSGQPQQVTISQKVYLRNMPR